MKENKFPERLRELRKQLNRKQGAVAEGCGIDRSTFWRYECGNLVPSMEAVKNIADYFAVSVDYLLGRTDNPKINN